MKKLLALVMAMVMLFSFAGCGDNDDKNRTCAWCNGTGYSGNGATTVEEYVFMKTPCKHCNGKGTY